MERVNSLAYGGSHFTGSLGGQRGVPIYEVSKLDIVSCVACHRATLNRTAGDWQPEAVNAWLCGCV